MKKIILFVALFFGFQYVSAQELEGKWVNTSFTGDENAAYEFQEGNILKMYYAGKEIPTKEPVKYNLTDKDDYRLISMSFFNKMNSRSENLVGRLEFLSDDQIKLEFWEKGRAPKGYAFTNEALTFNRAE